MGFSGNTFNAKNINNRSTKMETLAEIITIGDEILLGQIVDTNSAWLGEQFALHGVRVHQISSVSDNLEHIRQAVELAVGRADLVVITGGLGPTKDDITKVALSGLLGVDLMRDEATYLHVEQMLQRRGVEFNDSNKAQALVPRGCTVLRNDNGTAPGMCMEYNGTPIFSLPGVPFEMKALVMDQVLDLVAKRFSLMKSVHRTVITFGIAESVLSEKIEAWELALPPYLHLAYLPNPRAIRLRLSCYSSQGDKAEKEIEAQFLKLRAIIEPYYLGYEPSSVEGALSELLLSRSETLALAESCTGGAISARITAMPGSSAYYMGGVCSYSNQSKIDMLGVSAQTIEQFGAVSQQTVEQMAIGARTRLGATYAIATSGIAGPTGGTPDKPVGTIWMAIAWPGGVQSRMMQYGALREQNIERSATQALNMLRLHLMKVDDALQNTSLL